MLSLISRLARARRRCARIVTGLGGRGLCATDSGGLSVRRSAAEPLERRTMLSFSASINFQPASAPQYPGYSVDSGKAYGSRGNGLTYGWNTGPDLTSVDRNSTLSPDQRYDTFVQTQSGKSNYTWEIAVPNGTYSVHLAAGDPAQWNNSFYSFNVEGVSAINANPTSANRWAEATVVVTVNDGKLTVSNTASAKNNKIDFITVQATVPTAPTQLSASGGAAQATIKWADNSNNEDGFRIERSTDNVNFTEVGTVAANVTAYTATGLAGGTTYSFRVRAYNSTGTSAYTDAASALTLPDVATASATAAGRAHVVTVSWNNVTGESGYRLERSTNGTSWSTLATLPADTTTYDDAGLSENGAYQYRVWAIDATGSATAAPAASAATAPFRAFDGTNFTNKPSPLGLGIGPVLVAYQQSLLSGGAPDEASIRAEADQAAAAHENLALDIEAWPTDIRYASQATVDASIANLTQVIGYVRDEWAKTGAVDEQVGLYAILPPSAPVSPDGGAWQQACNYLKPFSAQIDFVCPELYTEYADPSDWALHAEQTLQEARIYGKPVYPFVWMRYPEYEPFGNNQLFPADQWGMELAVCRELGDGALLWSGIEPWDPSAAWWQTTQGFLAQPAQTPAAPSGLSLNTAGAHLSWQDNSSNEYGFTIDRSTDGVNFTHVATVQRNVTTWTDPQFTSGATYTYRASAMDGFGQSAYAAPVRGTVTRDAFAVNQAEGADASSGVAIAQQPIATALGSLDDGDWAEYKAVSFASGGSNGANQFVATIGAPDSSAGGRIEVRLDGLSGALIGTLTVAGTGDFWTFYPQSAPVTPTTGVHDVYLLFKGGWGLGNLDSFQFASNAAPAAPTRLAAQSGSGQISLTWTDDSGDETGFQIERSTDGVNFQPVASVAANATAYTDANIPADPPGTRTTYYYRVRATGAYANSGPANVASGIASLRDAFSEIQGESYDAMSGISTTTGSDIGNLDNGDWAAYYNVNFGAGATQFRCYIGLPDYAAGQQIEVHLDSLSNPAVGVLTTTSTGGYYVYQIELTSVTPVTGIHDVYLAFKGSYGVGSIEWFQFAA